MLKTSIDNSIIIDGKYTGLKIVQKQSGTVIYTPEELLTGQKYKEHKMPHARYSVVHDAPSSGSAGCFQLENDILELIKNNTK